MALKMTLKWMWLLAILFLAAPVCAGEPPVLKTQKDKVSYGIGVDMARNFKQQGVDFDADILLKGFKDQSSGGKLLMTEDDMRATLNAYQSEMLQKRTLAMKAAAEENQKDRGCFSGGEYKEGRRGDPAKRLAVQDSQSRRWQEADAS